LVATLLTPFTCCAAFTGAIRGSSRLHFSAAPKALRRNGCTAPRKASSVSAFIWCGSPQLSDQCRALQAPPRPRPVWSRHGTPWRLLPCPSAMVARLVLQLRSSVIGGRSVDCWTAPPPASAPKLRHLHFPMKLRLSP